MFDGIRLRDFLAEFKRMILYILGLQIEFFFYLLSVGEVFEPRKELVEWKHGVEWGMGNYSKFYILPS